MDGPRAAVAALPRITLDRKETREPASLATDDERETDRPSDCARLRPESNLDRPGPSPDTEEGHNSRCSRPINAQGTAACDRPSHLQASPANQHPHGESNPGLQDENLISWATRRWGPDTPRAAADLGPDSRGTGNLRGMVAGFQPPQRQNGPAIVSSTGGSYTHGTGSRPAGKVASTEPPGMPIFEFHCPSCERDFDEFVHSAKDADRTTCPSCGERGVTRKLSVFAAHGSAPAAGNPPPGGCGRCGDPDGPCGM